MKIVKYYRKNMLTYEMSSDIMFLQQKQKSMLAKAPTSYVT